MSTNFTQLIEKVEQAENALEAQERRMAADLRQLKASWKTGWTPGRIVIAGAVSGFLVGRAEPLKTVAKGGSIMQMITAVSGLFATATAQAAAGQAQDVADNVGHVAGDVGDVANTLSVSTPASDAIAETTP